MGSPTPGLVEKRFQSCAYMFVIISNSLVFFSFVFQVGSAYQNRENPPTVLTVKDGSQEVDGSAIWGTMPYLAFEVEGRDFERVHVHPKHWGRDLSRDFDGADSLKHATELCNSQLAIINLTMLSPRFFGEFGEILVPSVAIGLAFRYGQNDGPELNVMSAPGNINALHASCSSFEKSLWKRFPQVQMHLKPIFGMMEMMDFDIKKTFVPMLGTFWGLFDGSHLQEINDVSFASRQTFAMMGDQERPWGRAGRLDQDDIRLFFNIRSHIVTMVTPVSLWEQFKQSAAGAGGYLALIGSMFFLLFKRRTEPSEQELEQTQLTFFAEKTLKVRAGTRVDTESASESD